MRLSLFQGRVASAGGAQAPLRRTRMYEASALTMAVSIVAIVVGSMLSGLDVLRSEPEAWEYVGAWSLLACVSAPVTFVLAYVGLRAGGALLRGPSMLWAYVQLTLLGAALGAVAGLPWLVGAILAIGKAGITIETNRMLQIPVIVWASAAACTGIGLALARRRLQSFDTQEILRFLLSTGLVSLAVAAVTAVTLVVVAAQFGHKMCVDGIYDGRWYGKCGTETGFPFNAIVSGELEWALLWFAHLSLHLGWAFAALLAWQWRSRRWLALFLGNLLGMSAFWFVARALGGPQLGTAIAAASGLAGGIALATLGAITARWRLRTRPSLLVLFPVLLAVAVQIAVAAECINQDCSCCDERCPQLCRK